MRGPSFHYDSEWIVLDESFTYYSSRYGKYIYLEKGFKSDGATGAFDIHSIAYLVHDKLCDTGVFEDGTICSNWKASMILSDILRRDGFYIRKYTWFIATWFFGGGKARLNGMW